MRIMVPRSLAAIAFGAGATLGLVHVASPASQFARANHVPRPQAPLVRLGGAQGVIYAFQGLGDGGYPFSGLIGDSSGALYGTTSGGGVSGYGTVYKLTPSKRGNYTETVLYSFKGGADGLEPAGGSLVMDASGALYGTTWYGGINNCPGNAGCGTVFKLMPTGSGYTESILYAFKGGLDAGEPWAGLTMDGSGALYGTTEYGGGTGCSYAGCGAVFVLRPSGSSYTESVLYGFQGPPNDGEAPRGRPYIDKTGAIFGTTTTAGSGNGTVYKLTPSGSGYIESTIYNFQGGNDGAEPWGGVIADKYGTLFGTTLQGGTPLQCSGRAGCGTVYALVPFHFGHIRYVETVLYAFQPSGDGQNPESELIADKQGNLYGTTVNGGMDPSGCLPSGCGTAFRINATPSGPPTETILYFGSQQNGGNPASPLSAIKGTYYFTNYLYGAHTAGSVVRLKF